MPRTFFGWTLLVCILLVVAMGLVEIGRRLGNDRSQLEYRPPSSWESAAEATLPLELFVGETVYVPVYSHVFQQSGAPYLLAATVSVRNTDPKNPILITSARYYNTEGREVRSHLQKPLRLLPLASVAFFIEQSDTSGGPGASFLVDWAAETPVTEPVIESVMLGTMGSTQSVAFARPGKVIARKTSPEK